MPIALFLLAAGLFATALLGPLGLGLLIWRVSPSGLMQLYGAHIAELVLVVPTMAGAGWLWQRRHQLAPVLALGASAYALYVAVQFVLFPDYTLYAGNNERFFPLFLLIAILAWFVVVRAWAALGAGTSSPPRWLARTFTIVVLATNGLIGLTWTAQVLGIAARGTLPPGYTEAPTGFWLIRLVDLGVIVPLSVATAIGVWRGHALATRAAPGVASFLTLEVGAVLAMGLVQLWLRDPSASAGLIAALGPVFVALAGTTALLLRSWRGGALSAAPFGHARPIAAEGSGSGPIARPAVRTGCLATVDARAAGLAATHHSTLH